jgi:hypothetical protein
MKTQLQLEELLMLALGIAALYFQSVHISWWLWPVLFLSPDISMLGYLINTRIGAYTYNLFHHKGVAITVAGTGFFLLHPIAMFIGILLFTHACFDRVFGYGLKYPDSFQHTHLGIIGKKAANQ